MKKFSLLLMIIIAFVGCKKDGDELYTKSANDISFAEMNLMDCTKQMLDIIPSYTTHGKYLADTNVKVSVTKNANWPQTFTFNFGDKNLVGKDGKLRRGKIMVEMSSANFASSSFKMSFDNFFINETQMIGNIIYSKSQTGFDVNYAQGISFINANGTMKAYGDGVMTPTGGQQTPEAIDDIYSFSLSGNGQDFSGTSFTYASSLIHRIAFACRFMVTQGSTSVTPNGKNAQTVNYGTGSCDGNATVTSGTQSEAFVFQ